MTEFRSSLLKLLNERGYIHQVTDAEALDALAAKEVVTGYIGFDATAPSLHVGNLVSIMLLRRLQQVGHKPIVLMGDGPTDALLVNNDEWLGGLEYIPFLRDVGQHFTINRMLTFDSVRLRLDREQPMTFLEFNYMIL